MTTRTPRSWLLLMLACVGLMQACTTPLPPSIVQPKPVTLPKPAPELMTPPKSPESFSENARADIQQWREKLANSPSK